ncbi:hypothetical protein PF005_g18656 [Phytophthora fragariae]|uniref:Uncharacterized protein n=1 Tax=Phytophthora fragariae TaxID=53985 RepID=A0A6A3ECW4_9STRA|nr:hypothetical protein PF003_g28579 [Phytophthora fragariae]KAE8930393.1 hypothetical protein PF009_g19515 [Phytophthora fragariae]KAE8991929.1 hypothetical protein PF011_g17748 [Phytophthora fragariae]KAE9091812.1 hypothetical protein PF010_g18042 [Phytophthora fragariae]KAE9107202.1 hypothetical protein PF007_g13124 [Phytophthora fragariae]
MTISRSVYNQLFEQAPDAAGGGSKEKVIRLRPTEAKAGAVVMSAKSKIQMWTKEEHERFLAALEKFPAGPWKKVADFIGTKTPRQTMTHAQKYRQKIHRRQRGLRNQKKSNNNSNSNSEATAEAEATSSPAPVDTKADLKGEPEAIVSPYGVADLQLKPGSEAAAAAAAGATNDQLLNILAQQATTIQGNPQAEAQAEPMEVDSAVTVDASASPEANAAGQGSPNNNLPSLAEILHLGGAEGQAAAAAQGEKAQTSPVEAEGEEKTEVKTEEAKADTDATATETAAPASTKPRPEECSAHEGKKPAVEETTTQPRPVEI